MRVERGLRGPRDRLRCLFPLRSRALLRVLLLALLLLLGLALGLVRSQVHRLRQDQIKIGKYKEK